MQEVTVKRHSLKKTSEFSSWCLWYSYCQLLVSACHHSCFTCSCWVCPCLYCNEFKIRWLSSVWKWDKRHRNQALHHRSDKASKCIPIRAETFPKHLIKALRTFQQELWKKQGSLWDKLWPNMVQYHEEVLFSIMKKYYSVLFRSIIQNFWRSSRVLDS